MNKYLVLSFLSLCSFIMAAKERKLRRISIDDDEEVILSSGISCIQIESINTCYAVNANRSVIHFLNKNIAKWSSWNMLILEDPDYDIKLDGISCVTRKNLPKCYLRMINLGIEHLIEINPSKENWYQLCDHLAIKPITILTKENNLHIISRTIEKEFYHKFIQNSQWNLKKIFPENLFLIGQSNCLSINDNEQMICLSRTTNPTRLAIWSREERNFQSIDNNIQLSSDLSCLTIRDDEQTKILCFVVNQNENLYGILCQTNFICSKWFLISSRKISFEKLQPISFVYQSWNNKFDNLAIYALGTNGLPYITTCQECISSFENLNDQWSEWMELTSIPLQSIETFFQDFQEKKIYILALTNNSKLIYSIFDFQNHIPSPFYQINNQISSFII